MAGLIQELKRRNVFRVAGLYLVVAWLLIQVASVFETALKLPDWFDGLVTALILLGFPVALILAWAFEVTPDGVRRTAPDEGPRPASSTLDYVLIVSLWAVGGLIVYDRLLPTPPVAAAEAPADSQAEAAAGSGKEAPSATPTAGANGAPSVAVLPFVDLSPSNDQEYFSDGLAEEILNVLTRMSNMKVAGRTSSFAKGWWVIPTRPCGW